MSTTLISEPLAGTETTRPAQFKNRGHLFGPVLDFVCLGGGSLVLLAALALLHTRYDSADLFAATLLLANFINHPHFAHSYQIFYRGFGEKVLSPQYSALLRVRYCFAGIVAPIILCGFFVFAVLNANLTVLGQAANVMALLVGWHYVKQGYGILIVMSVKEKKFFTQMQKNIFLANSYACWGTFWLCVNWLATEKNYWGIKHYMLHIPDAMLWGAVCVAALTSVLAVGIVVHRLRTGAGVPFNGVVAYGTTLYAWLALLLHPVYALVVPACHSMQYLVVVWRYQLNYEHGRVGNPEVQVGKTYSTSPVFRFAVFVVSGAVLGYLGFWALPDFLDARVPYDHGMFGTSLFLFIFWIFINVHHYLLDNVMWRKGNRDTGRYLFGS